MNRSEAGKIGFQKSKIILEIKFLNRILNYENSPNLCSLCKIILSYKHRKNKFCSHKCAASFCNSSRKLKRRLCRVCQKPVNRPALKRCSACYLVSKDFALLKCDGARKKSLIKEYGVKCQICSNTHWMGSHIPIEMDHIDGNYTNNIKENLRLICPNCHAQTLTYKGKNKGKGRLNRKKIANIAQLAEQ